MNEKREREERIEEERDRKVTSFCARNKRMPMTLEHEPRDVHVQTHYRVNKKARKNRNTKGKTQGRGRRENVQKNGAQGISLFRGPQIRPTDRTGRLDERDASPLLSSRT